MKVGHTQFLISSPGKMFHIFKTQIFLFLSSMYKLNFQVPPAVGPTVECESRPSLCNPFGSWKPTCGIFWDSANEERKTQRRRLCWLSWGHRPAIQKGAEREASWVQLGPATGLCPLSHRMGAGSSFPCLPCQGPYTRTYTSHHGHHHCHHRCPSCDLDGTPFIATFC